MRSRLLAVAALSSLFAAACGGAAKSAEYNAATPAKAADGYGAPVAPAPDVAEEEGAAPAPAPAGVPPLTPHATSATTAPYAGGSAAPVAIVPSSPSVKAGEWDDNANWREFNKWVATEERQPFHRADVSTRRFLVVRDRDGKAVPRCAVSLVDEAQHTVTLTTTASGRAILFPKAEGLGGHQVRASARCAGNTAAEQTFAIDDAPDGVVDLRLDGARSLPAQRTIDVAFVLDTTGSMGEEIAGVKSTISKVASQLRRSDLRVRIGMVAFKDRGDEYVTRTFPMTTDLDAFARQVENIQAGGGGDMPESVNEGVHVALSGLEWGSDSVAQMAFLVGDAPPHLDYAHDFDYAAEMRGAAHRGIELYTIAASGMDDLGQIVWRQMAQYTGATNLFVLRGGAGPQSTGAGDPKSSCGGTQTQYTSGALDQLVLAKIKREIGAVDRDPMRIAGLGQDEDAKPCDKRVFVAE
jgi:Mg-chelatase subunit ChlD